MKKIVFLTLFIISNTVLFAQSIVGDWSGVLAIGGVELHLIFHITEKDGKYIATMDSPDQGANGIPASSTTYADGVLEIAIASAGLKYTGSIDPNSVNIIKGNLNQGGRTFEIDLARINKLEENYNKSSAKQQDPVKPYPYYTKEVVFTNNFDGVTLSGTLTKPKKKGKFPAVVLVSGSGPQNRDEELLGHRPFLVLADYLTRNGIAVLRYDDRGTASSTGDFANSTTEDFARDAKAAVSFLKSQKGITKVGIIGHSEGGLIAPMVAAEMPDLAFVVLLAGPGIKGDSLLLLQQFLIGKANGSSKSDLEKAAELNKGAFDLMLRSDDLAEITKDLKNYFTIKVASAPASMKPTGMTEAQIVDYLLAQYANKWMIKFIKTDPTVYLEKTKCPVLALNGEKDLQVPPKENLDAIAKAVKSNGNTKVQTITLPGLNHLFQECKTGSPSEYATIEQTFSPKALEIIGNWILEVE